MAALVWLLIPVAGALIASLWGAWAARRSTGAGGMHDSTGVRRYEAFRAAMERPTRTAAHAARTKSPAAAGTAAAVPLGVGPATSPSASPPVPPAPVVLTVRTPARADG